MILETSKVSLYYEKSGAGSPIILLHGNGEEHGIFDEAAEVLSKYFTVYAVDSRGHGKSSPVSEFHYADMAEDIREFIEKLQLQKPIVYGFSDGGIIAILLAIKYQHLLSQIVVSGVNTKPTGVKWHWYGLFKLMYIFNKSPLFKLMVTEPHITKEELSTIKIPVHITAGRKDMISISHMQKIADAIPGSTFRIFDGEDHGSYITHSDKIARYIVEMVRS